MTANYFLADHLRKIMRLKQFTIARLAQEANVSEDTIKSIRSGRTPNPGINVMISLANALDCSLDDLVGRSSFSNEETSLLQRYYTLSERGRALVKLILDSELSPSTAEHIPQRRELPCVLFHNYEAGTYVYKPDTPETISLPENYMDKADFAIHICTNRVSPYFFPGDYLAIRRRLPNHGEISVFTRDGFAYLRRYEKRGEKSLLLPLTRDPDSVPLEYDDSLTCLGTFIGIIKLN